MNKNNSLQNKNFVFVANDASLSGAPLFFLNWIKWLQDNLNINLRILLIRGGVLENDFRLTGQTYVWGGHHLDDNASEKLLGKINVQLKQKRFQTKIIKELQAFNPHIVFCNTIVSLPLAFQLKQHINVPFVLHIHEMQFSIENFYNDYINQKFLAVIDKFIVVNSKIKFFLENSFVVEPSKVEIIPPFFISNPVSEVTCDDATFVVGFSGFGSWRKGIDLLPILIAKMKYCCDISNFKFIWVGRIDEEIILKIRYELELLNCLHLVTFTGEIFDTVKVYQTFNVFCLLSREDPFPLVCLETAHLKIPIICFKGTGGMEDFVQDGVTGYVIPFLNLDYLHEKLLYLKNHPAKRIEMGKQAAVASQEYRISKLAPMMLKIAEDL